MDARKQEPIPLDQLIRRLRRSTPVVVA